MLLASAGIRNPSIHNALVDLLGKPIEEASALCIPTATQVFGKPEPAYSFIGGHGSSTPMCELGWTSVSVLKLTALPGINRER